MNFANNDITDRIEEHTVDLPLVTICALWKAITVSAVDLSNDDIQYLVRCSIVSLDNMLKVEKLDYAEEELLNILKGNMKIALGNANRYGEVVRYSDPDDFGKSAR